MQCVRSLDNGGWQNRRRRLKYKDLLWCEKSYLDVISKEPMGYKGKAINSSIVKDVVGTKKVIVEDDNDSD